jgi:hypothetical protein
MGVPEREDLVVGADQTKITSNMKRTQRASATFG